MLSAGHGESSRQIEERFGPLRAQRKWMVTHTPFPEQACAPQVLSGPPSWLRDLARHCRAPSSGSSLVPAGPVTLCTESCPQAGTRSLNGKVTAKGPQLWQRLHSLPPPGRLSVGSFLAFSLERLMGFPLLSDSCWKCHCAHNCYVAMEAAPLPRARASFRKRNCTCEEFAACWLLGLCPGLPLVQDWPGKKQIPAEAFGFPEPNGWHWGQGRSGVMSSYSEEKTTNSARISLTNS